MDEQAWDWLRDQSVKNAEAEALKRRAEAIIEENDLVRRCVSMEGEHRFWTWWEAEGVRLPMEERMELMKRRLSVHERSVAKEASDGDKSEEKAG